MGDADYLQDLFAPFGPIVLRRMFGGLGIFRDGLMFGLVTGGEIFLKADAESAPLFRAAGSTPFRYEKADRIVETSYHSLPEAALDDPDALVRWAELAHATARKKDAGKARRKPKAVSRRPRPSGA